MRLFDRVKQAFKPHLHDTTQSYYIPSINYANDPIENSIWRSELDKRLQDWKGDTGRVPNAQVLSLQGPILFAIQGSILAGVGGNNFAYGQGGSYPVAGFAGRPAQIDSTSTAAEYDAVQV